MADEFERSSRPGKEPEGEDAQAADDAKPQAEATGGEPEARIRELETELQVKTEEAARNFDLYLRERAEGENFRKRLQRDKVEAIRYGSETLVRDLLPLLDNLELAVEHAGLGGNGKSVVEGIQLIVRMFRDVLDRHGVKPIEVPSGAVFDPSIHEAAGVENAPGTVPNSVIRQELRGYQLHERLLRPARVVVAASAPPRDGEAEKDEE
ncbi:MAG: nucleotide exchange factor GrpE [Candidatus Binatia bacterium]